MKKRLLSVFILLFLPNHVKPALAENRQQQVISSSLEMICRYPTPPQKRILVDLERETGMADGYRDCKALSRSVLSRPNLPALAKKLLGLSKKSQKGPERVMLAQNWKRKQDVTEWWMSEKLDGIRALWNGTQLITRMGNAVHAPNWFLKKFPPFPIDGELWIGRGKFSKTVSIVRKKNPNDQEWRQIRFAIFDAPQSATKFEERQAFLKRFFQHDEKNQLFLLRQTQCKGKKHLLRELERITENGGEGVMLRKPFSSYEYKRSHNLLKVKKFRDGEAVVLGYKPGKGKYKGQMGALLVELPNGIRFSIGSGFSDQERKNPPQPGTKVRFRYQNLTKAGKPRFPSYLGPFQGI